MPEGKVLQDRWLRSLAKYLYQKPSLTAGFFYAPSFLVQKQDSKMNDEVKPHGVIDGISVKKSICIPFDMGGDSSDAMAYALRGFGKPLVAYNKITEYFHYSHLPAHLQAVSKPLGDVAHLMHVSLPDSAEKSAGLRKLLEAKDCFVRCAVDNKDLKIDLGPMSDGYHTFNELYAHRMVLFAVICHANQSHAWKSKLHHDGTMYEKYFIVGVNTPEGQFSYHYSLNHWDLFNVQVLDKAPEWDGHTANDVDRLHSLNGDSHA